MNDIFLLKRRKLDSLLRLRKNAAPDEILECPGCHGKISSDKLKKKYFVCPDCHYYFSMTPSDRIAMIGDEDSFREMSPDLRTRNPLDFPGYAKKLETNRKKTGQEDAIVTGVLKINGKKAAVGVLDSRFLMGSMGTVVGEKIALLAEYAAKRKLPLILFSASGGARMQEGLFSLMQMAKTCAAVEKFKESGGLFISCLTNPTTGGVSASFANLGDIIMAEPGALICFAGPRVIEQTIGQTLPEGFQRSEFLLEHGMIDMVCERSEMKNVISRLIKMHQRV